MSQESEFTVWLRDQMRSRRMTQRGLAKLAGVDHSTICRLLRNGRAPMLDTALALQAVLGAPGQPVRLHPIGRVESALRSDPHLVDADILDIMRLYMARRSRPRVVLPPAGIPAPAIRRADGEVAV